MILNFFEPPPSLLQTRNRRLNDMMRQMSHLFAPFECFLQDSDPPLPHFSVLQFKLNANDILMMHARKKSNFFNCAPAKES